MSSCSQIKYLWHKLIRRIRAIAAPACQALLESARHDDVPYHVRILWFAVDVDIKGIRGVVRRIDKSLNHIVTSIGDGEIERCTPAIGGHRRLHGLRNIIVRQNKRRRNYTRTGRESQSLS